MKAGTAKVHIRILDRHIMCFVAAAFYLPHRMRNQTPYWCGNMRQWRRSDLRRRRVVRRRWRRPGICFICFAQFFYASTMPSMLPNPALCHACFFCGPATTPPACAFACALPRCISLAGGVFSISKNLTFFKSDIQHNIQYHDASQTNARKQS